MGASTDALARLVVTIGANTAEFSKAMQQTTGGLQNFTSKLGSIASSIGVAFGVREVAQFGFEISKLAGEAEGVKNAFDRLPESVRVMEQLKTATGGTVSELDLMKAAVQANNFQIPIENLASLFKFATLRAQQTGQSVDYLVQSIILGIGRKSPLILDNLGISAVRLREKLKGVSAEAATVGDVAKVVGDIASEELQNMAGFSENAATKIQRLSASWVNLKVSMGNVANGSGVLADVLDGLTTIMDQFNSGPSDEFLVLQSQLAQSIKAESVPAVEKLIAQLTGLRNEFGVLADNTKVLNMAKAFQLSDEQAARFFNTMVKINGEIKNTPTVEFQALADTTTINGLQEKLKQLNEAFEQLDVTNKESLVTKGQEIIAIDNQIKKLNELRKANEDVTGLSAVRAKLAEITKELESTNLADVNRLNTLRQQKQALDEFIKSQERLNALKKESFLVDTSAVPLTKLFDLEGMEKLLEKLGLLTQKFRQAQAAASGAFNEIKKGTQDIGPMISGLVAGVADALGSVTDKQRNFGQDILATLASFAQQFGSLLITMGVAKIALDAFSGPVMIAAGVALVAAGAAIKGLVANRSNRSSTSGSSAVSNSSRAISGASAGIISVIPEGEWRISGRDLVFVYDKNKGLDGSRRG